MQKELFATLHESVTGLRNSLSGYIMYHTCRQKRKYQRLHNNIMMEVSAAFSTDNSTVHYVTKCTDVSGSLKPLNDALQSKSTY